MADYKTWMLTGYRQNHTNGREGLQYWHNTGLTSHRYFSDWNSVDLSSWSAVLQSDHGSFNNSNGRYYCYTEGVVFSTITLMYTNPNTRDFHVALYKNGSRISLSNDHAGGGSGNGHQWNGATTSALCRVAEGDYITCRFIASNGASSGTRGYVYGGGDYNNFTGYYIPGAQRDDPST